MGMELTDFSNSLFPLFGDGLVMVMSWVFILISYSTPLYNPGDMLPNATSIAQVHSGDNDNKNFHNYDEYLCSFNQLLTSSASLSSHAALALMASMLCESDMSKPLVLLVLKNASMSLMWSRCVKLDVVMETTELSMLKLGGSLFSSSAQLSLTHCHSAMQPSGWDLSAVMGR